jgi:hypothetical protein
LVRDEREEAVTDRHYTTPELALAIVARLIKSGDLLPGDRVLDPCVGLGAFSNAVRALCPDAKLRTIDEDPEVDADIHGDFLAVPARGSFDLVVSNPPFSLAQRFVEKSLGLCDPRGCVAFLMLVQFLGSTGRREFFTQYPPSSVEVIRPRPSFSDDGASDMREYALFRWHPQDFEVLRKREAPGFIDWEKPRKIRTAKAEK